MVLEPLPGHRLRALGHFVPTPMLRRARTAFAGR